MQLEWGVLENLEDTANAMPYRMHSGFCRMIYLFHDFLNITITLLKIIITDFNGIFFKCSLIS
jgi:hypothetical protein